MKKVISNEDLANLFESGSLFKLFNKTIKKLIKNDSIKCVGYINLDLDKGLYAPMTHLMYDSIGKAGVVYLVSREGDITKISEEQEGEVTLGNIFEPIEVEENKDLILRTNGITVVAGLKGEGLRELELPF